jgi:hypothetical protein
MPPPNIGAMKSFGAGFKGAAPTSPRGPVRRDYPRTPPIQPVPGTPEADQFDVRRRAAAGGPGGPPGLPTPQLTPAGIPGVGQDGALTGMNAGAGLVPTTPNPLSLTGQQPRVARRTPQVIPSIAGRRV